MLIKFNSVDDIFPSLEALSNLGVTFKTNDDDSVVIELNAPEFKIVENKDMPILLSSNFENADSSLLYFIIKENRIMFELLGENTILSNIISCFNVFYKLKESEA